MSIKDTKLGFTSTTSFVIANMVGTGVFTSLGFQLLGITNFYTILILWALGGVIALCGALVYGELGSAMPRSGGEYHYLSQIYHPAIGFLSGWVSMTVGFAAPVALACMAFAKYFSNIYNEFSPTLLAIIVLTAITLVHSFTIKIGGRFQSIFTITKVCFVILFIACGLIIPTHFQDFTIHAKSFSLKSLAQPAFAVSLIYVMYAFSGWNAAAYIAGDIKNPKKLIPRALLLSTILVTVIYVLLNYVFLLTTPAPELAGQLDIGTISAIKIFGTLGGKIMGIFVSLLLISTISSMIFVGPRVSQVMGEDTKILKFLSVKSRFGSPYVAVWLQFAFSLVYIITSSFDVVLKYTGFTLNFLTLLTVIGLFVHRYKYPTIERPYKTWGYPFVPLVFIAIMLWTLIFLTQTCPKESLIGLGIMASGLAIYFIDKKLFN